MSISSDFLSFLIKFCSYFTQEIFMYVLCFCFGYLMVNYHKYNMRLRIKISTTKIIASYCELNEKVPGQFTV